MTLGERERELDTSTTVGAVSLLPPFTPNPITTQFTIHTLIIHNTNQSHIQQVFKVSSIKQSTENRINYRFE